MRAPGFTEDWFCQESRELLARLVRSVVDVDGLIVEIGSWEGRSSVTLAHAAHPRIIECVDTWLGSPDDVSSELAAERDVCAQWCVNVAAFTEGNVRAHRMGWREFVPTIDEPVAFCFIDAEHTYLEVHDNLRAVLPLMAPGGIICGDDVHHPPVKAAVADVLDPNEVNVEATCWWWRVPT